MEQGGEGGEVRERVGPAEIKAEQGYLVLTHTSNYKSHFSAALIGRYCAYILM